METLIAPYGQPVTRVTPAVRSTPMSDGPSPGHPTVNLRYTLSWMNGRERVVRDLHPEHGPRIFGRRTEKEITDEMVGWDQFSLGYVDDPMVWEVKSYGATNPTRVRRFGDEHETVVFQVMIYDGDELLA